MKMHLGRYARTPQPWWADRTGRIAIGLSLVVVVNVGLIVWWIAPSDAQPSGEMVEVVEYYDIMAVPGPGETLQMPPPSPGAAPEPSAGAEAKADAPAAPATPQP